MFLSSSDIAKTFVLLCLKCYVDKEDNLMFHASFNVYALYCFHLSCHQLSSQSLASQNSVPSRILLVLPYPETKHLPLESTIPSYLWYSTTTPKVYNLCAIFRC